MVDLEDNPYRNPADKDINNNENKLEEFWDDAQEEKFSDNATASLVVNNEYDKQPCEIPLFPKTKQNYIAKGEDNAHRDSYVETAPNQEGNYLISEPSTSPMIKRKLPPNLNCSNGHLNASANSIKDNVHLTTEYNIRKSILERMTKPSNPKKYSFVKSIVKENYIQRKPKQRTLSSDPVKIITYSNSNSTGPGKSSGSNKAKKRNTRNVDGFNRVEYNIYRIKTPLLKNKERKKHNFSSENISPKTGRSHTPTKNLKLYPSPKKLERLKSMYNKGREKEEKKKKLQEEKMEKAKIKELEDCPFRPNLVSKHHSKLENQCFNENSKMPIYERHLLWNAKKSNKIEREKNKSALQEQQKCTFVPEVTKGIPEYQLVRHYDKTTRKYFERVSKAKQKKDEVNSKLNPNYNDIYDKLVKKKKENNVRCITFSSNCPNEGGNENRVTAEEYQTFNPNKDKIDYGTAKMQLHSTLHTLQMGDKINVDE